MSRIAAICTWMVAAGAATSEENAPAQCSSLLQVKADTGKGKQEHTQVSLNQTETDFLTALFRSYGKQATNYSGAQTLRGFRSNEFVDDQGMFAFDNISSVAIDVGAANNPLTFDMDWDANQVVLAFEPIFADQLAGDLEKAAEELNARGGCKTRWDSFCANERLVIFPTAVSSEVGRTTFHLSDNPYCGSLNEVPGGLDPSLVNHPDPEVSDVMKACWGSLKKENVKEVSTVTLASILRRIPKHIRVKYVKIDAQGQDYKVLLSAGEEMSRIEYVRFEMQVDPLPGRKMVADIPSYAEVASKMKEWGFVHEGDTACNFDGGSSPFSKAIEEKECVFCRTLPCKENGVDLGTNPRDLLEVA